MSKLGILLFAGGYGLAVAGGFLLRTVTSTWASVSWGVVTVTAWIAATIGVWLTVPDSKNQRVLRVVAALVTVWSAWGTLRAIQYIWERM